jgi:hypothetical protein
MFFAEQISHVALLTSATWGVFRGLPYFVRALGYRAGTSEPANLTPAAPEDVAKQSRRSSPSGSWSISSDRASSS